MMLNSIVAKIFSKISFSPLQLKGNNGFFDGHRTSPLVSFAPHPNPPPRRGEGRVGVMLLMSFLHCLGEVRQHGQIHQQLNE